MASRVLVTPKDKLEYEGNRKESNAFNELDRAGERLGTEYLDLLLTMKPYEIRKAIELMT